MIGRLLCALKLHHWHHGLNYDVCVRRACRGRLDAIRSVHNRGRGRS